MRTIGDQAQRLARPGTVGGTAIEPVEFGREHLDIGLRTLQTLVRTDWPLLLAGCVVMTVPILLVFLVAQRAFWPEDRVGGLGGR